MFVGCYFMRSNCLEVLVLNDTVRELSAKELVDMYAVMIYRLAYSRLNSVQDAEDITQEVLLKYIRCGKKFRDEEHRKAWLLRVAVNAVKSMATSAYNRHRAGLKEAAELTYESKEPSGVAEAVAGLPEKYKTAIHLFYFEDLSVKQIAKITGKTEGTVKSLLFRGREKLKEILKEGNCDV